MKKEYDFSKAIRNPYVDKNFAQNISVALDKKTMKYVKEMAEKKGVGIARVINILLSDCVEKKIDIDVGR